MRRIAIMGTAGVVAATAATFALTTLTTPTAQASELTPFGNCNELRDWYVEAALPQVSAWGWNGYGWGYYTTRGDMIAVPSAAAAEDSAGVSSSNTGTNVQEAGVDEPDFAKTNGSVTLHIVNGRTLVVTDVSGDDPVELARYRFPKDMYASEMLLVGDTAVVYGASVNDVKPVPYAADDMIRPFPYFMSEPEARVLTISIADPGAPTLKADRRIDGSVLTMRQYGDVVRVVTTSGYPNLDFVYPDKNTTENEALRHNRQVVKESAIDDWLPRISSGAKDDGSALVACSDVSHPAEQSGFGTISILTFRADDIDAHRSIAVTAGGDLVYSSSDRLYLATTSWGWGGGPVPMVGIAVPEDDVAFDDTGEGDTPAAPPAATDPSGQITDGTVIGDDDPGSTEPGSSGGGSDPSTGSEPGSSGGGSGSSGDPDGSGSETPDEPTTKPSEEPADDAPDAVSEPPDKAGDSRAERQDDIATEIHAFSLDGLETAYLASGEVKGTVKDRWSFSEYDHVLRVATGLGEAWLPTDNAITTLREDGDQLVVVGRVRGLGPDEQIQSVRWLGDLAVLVTFRQTDPLYTVDLSDPAHPRVLGQLKIPGFSAYLHPVGSDRLVGIGQDAKPNGQTIGGQAALFDISDVTDPQRLDTFSFGRHSYPAASWEPRAFTYLPDQGLVVTPVTGYRGTTKVFVLRVGDDGTLTQQQAVPISDGWAEGIRALPLEGGRVAIVSNQSVTILDL